MTSLPKIFQLLELWTEVGPEGGVSQQAGRLKGRIHVSSMRRYNMGRWWLGSKEGLMRSLSLCRVMAAPHVILPIRQHRGSAYIPESGQARHLWKAGPQLERSDAEFQCHPH